MLKMKFAAVALTVTSLLLTITGCNTQPNHPNQINTFDGASYDTLTLAHGALLSLRAQVSTNYPHYTPVFNEAAAAYTTALDAYTVFRASHGSQAAVSVAINNLTVSIVALEDTFQTDLHVSPAVILKTRAKAAKLRAAVVAHASPQISVSDILTALEIAASIAATVPGAQPYSALAAMIIAATQQALAAESAASGQPIDLSTLQPVPAIQ